MADREVTEELTTIMEGRGYSWHTINHWLQIQIVDSILANQNILQGWNLHCEEKMKWEVMDRRSSIDPRHNRICLFNLHVIPVLAGLGKYHAAR